MRASAFLRATVAPARAAQRTSHLRLLSTRETARIATTASLVRTRTSARALTLVSFATLATASVALAAPVKKMESADAIKAEELYNNNAYDRRTLLANLREMHNGAFTCSCCCCGKDPWSMCLSTCTSA